MKREPVRYILFDCMETLIDMTELPTLRDYAEWAFVGSGVEGEWKSFEQFFILYRQAKDALSAERPLHQDYEMRERFLRIASMQLGDSAQAEIAAQKLYQCYWRNYAARCYVKEDVQEVLQKLYTRIPMGVVSNFMVMDGIEKLLQQTDIVKYFHFVITSVREGWRKPHPLIFKTALERTGVPASSVLFVGDDYVNDFNGASDAGMQAVLLDRSGRYPHITSKIHNFYGILNICDI